MITYNVKWTCEICNREQGPSERAFLWEVEGHSYICQNCFDIKTTHERLVEMFTESAREDTEIDLDPSPSWWLARQPVTSFIDLPWHPLGNPGLVSIYDRDKRDSKICPAVCTMGAFFGAPEEPFPNADIVLQYLDREKDAAIENEVRAAIDANDKRLFAKARLHLVRVLRLLN